MNETEGLHALYAASYARLVGVVGAIAGDRDTAEEAVQDAFVRLIPQWAKVSNYDDPEAWLRKVALGYLSKRRRRDRIFTRAISRLAPHSEVPPPSGDRVDLDRALDLLPLHQRVVVVLHSLGWDTATIAMTLSIPVGTVKSRLSRGRSNLALATREDEGSCV